MPRFPPSPEPKRKIIYGSPYNVALNEDCIKVMQQLRNFPEIEAITITVNKISVKWKD